MSSKRFVSLAAITLATLVSVTAILAARQPPAPPKLQYFECGAAGEACEVGGRHYNIVAPEGRGPFPVVILFHGSKQSGDAYIQTKGLVEPFIRRGYAFVAPTALDINYSNGPGTGWLNTGERNGRNDHRFVDDMLDDLARRFPIDDQRILVAGQSNGAIFSWFLACANVDPRLRHFAPHGGTPGVGRFDGCQGSDLGFNLLHAHGREDHVVPARGGFRENGTWNYHNPEELTLFFAIQAGCKTFSQDAQGAYDKTTHTACDTGQEYSIAFHDGGHGVPRDWPDFIMDWFEAH